MKALPPMLISPPVISVFRTETVDPRKDGPEAERIPDVTKEAPEETQPVTKHDPRIRWTEPMSKLPFTDSEPSRHELCNIDTSPE
jgi:hypothetical protein